MKWLKHFFEKFTSNDDEEFLEDEDKMEEEESEQYEVKEEPKKPFRFPIIDDIEIKHEPLNNNFQPKPKKETVSNEIYDVQEPGIRELLEQRRKNVKYSYKSYSYNPKPIKFREQINNETTLKKENISEPKKRKIEKVELNEPTINRKRFIPSDVPSPVFGFQKKKVVEKDKDSTDLLKDEEIKSKEEVSSTVQLFEHQQETPQINDNVDIFHEENSIHNKSNVEEPQQNDLNNEKASEKNQTNEQQQNDINEVPLLQKDDYKEKIESPIVQGELTEQIEHQQYSQGNETESTIAQVNIEETTEINTNISQQEETNFELNEIRNESIQSSHIDSHQDEIDLPLEKDLIIQQSHNELQEVYDVEEINKDSTINNDEPLRSVSNWDVHNNIDNTDVQIEQNFEEQIEQLQKQSDNQEENEIKLCEQLTETTNEKIAEQSKEEKKKFSTRSTLPFNVLMLKSDKEKLAKKLAQSNTNAQTPSNVYTKKDENHNTNEVEEQKNLYERPPIHFLTPPEEKIIDQEWMESQGNKLIEALSYFQISAELQDIMQGPAVTQFEITVAHGIKVSKIRNLADDLKLALAAKDIRIQAPIPGKSTIGIEIPNRISRAVRLSEVVTSESFKQSDSPLEAALGLDLTGKPVTIDLRKMPHGLIAGATGSGKSVCINSILVSLLYKADPSELKLMLIDPKMVELAPFNNIPHLVSPVITDVKAATAALKWAVEEMERRYQLFAQTGVRDLTRFNNVALKNNEQPLPYILIVIDELADLMMMSPTDVEEAICRIAQKARACGIHLIVATQRPSVDVITGLIKSNIPTRIAFAVSSQVDSRTILDQQGADRLLGRGDMLYLGNGMSAPIRIQGTFVTDDEIETIVDFIKQQGEPNYFFEQEELLKKTEMVEEQDELFEEVCRFVAEQGSASTSSIQRRYHIGYNRAARLIDMLEQQGYISEQRGSKPREVYISVSDLASIFKE